MAIAQLLQLGARAFSQSGTNAAHLPEENVVAALANLLGGDADGTGIDLSTLLERLSSAGLMNLAESWLGDGDNAPLTAPQLSRALGQDKLTSFATQLGLEQSDAEAGLVQAIPAIIDKASSDGQLLELSGGAEGIMGMVGKLFGKS
ncbi:hypothetical protein KUV89_05930 [Marinobacter hydrocarbonoclasticus]|nr:hypothetical protein [Marinobacter nauticus]